MAILIRNFSFLICRYILIFGRYEIMLTSIHDRAGDEKNDTRLVCEKKNRTILRGSFLARLFVIDTNYYELEAMILWFECAIFCKSNEILKSINSCYFSLALNSYNCNSIWFFY